MIQKIAKIFGYERKFRNSIENWGRLADVAVIGGIRSSDQFVRLRW